MTEISETRSGPAPDLWLADAAAPGPSAAVKTAPRRPEEQTLLILGASGDLTARLLLPGLGGLLASESIADLRLVGSALDDWDDDRWGSQIAESFASAHASGREVGAVASNARYLRADVTDKKDWRRLLDACSGRLILYFALPPAITEEACQVLMGVELPAGTRLAMEKPFGNDAQSAAILNDV